MFKIVLLLLALIAAWAFLTDHGREWLSKKAGINISSPPPPPPPPEANIDSHPAVLQLMSRIQEKDNKIQMLEKELANELEARSQLKNPAFRTDPTFLENSMKRVRQEREVLLQELNMLKSRLSAQAPR